MAGDLETKLIMKRPWSERESFTAVRNDSFTKSTAGQLKPELHKFNGERFVMTSELKD